MEERTESEDTNEYCTSQINEAAYLIMMGHKVRGMKPRGANRRWVVYAFGPEARETARAYEDGTATVNLKQFIAAQRDSKSLLTLELRGKLS